MIPKINYPETLDTNQNLFSVSDSLRVTLSEDYNPGDTSISIFGDEDTIRSFDETGIITLTEQCSDPELRALSFYYSSRTMTSFNNLELLPGFIDCPKPKNITNVTQNVVSIHHNNLKDALINIENFAGIEGSTGTVPLKGTMEERINYLRRIALVPKPWFKTNKTVGLSPLTVEFTDQSFMLATDTLARSVTHIWDFGDNTQVSNISLISVIDSIVPSNISNIKAEVVCPAESVCVVEKTYSKPGIYDVSLTVKNDFGTHSSEDTVTFPKLINVRFPAPNEAVIDITSRSGQIVTPGTPSIGPYETPTKIRSPINSIIQIQIREENDREVPGSYTDENGLNRTQAGEVVNETGSPIDPINYYTWSFSDDIAHSNSKSTKALFGIGGYFDLILRTDTEFGSYRITKYKDAFDIVENYNLWLWNFDANETNVFSYEFGLISQTFKVKQSPTTINTLINESFLDNTSSEQQAKKEFKRNNGAAKRGTSPSGSGGQSLIYWSSGRSASDPKSSEKIVMYEFNGFQETYLSKTEINRQWNWIDLVHQGNLYFIFGSDINNESNQTKVKYNLESYTYNQSNLSNDNYKNSAEELQTNTTTFTHEDETIGSFSVFRSTWHEDSGYFLRAEGGIFFRMGSFYKTSGNSTEAFIDIRKLADLPGSRVEGQLVSLSQGVYFFNNSGTVSAYGAITNAWTTGGPGSASLDFRSLQDTTKLGFDDPSNTLLVESDESQIAFLSFDYSEKSFMQFNQSDMTFKSLTDRPVGNQWQMYIF